MYVSISAVCRVFVWEKKRKYGLGGRVRCVLLVCFFNLCPHTGQRLVIVNSLNVKKSCAFPVGVNFSDCPVVLLRSMAKIEETSLHLVYPPNWKSSHFVSVAKWASQTCTEFGTDVKTSVPFPVVTPTKTDCLIKQRPQFITLMNSWLGLQWKGDDIHTDRAHFQRTYSKLWRQRGRESFCPDLGLSCYSHCWCVSATCVCVRPPLQQPACFVISDWAGCPQNCWRKETKRGFEWAELSLAFSRGETDQCRFK